MVASTASPCGRGLGETALYFNYLAFSVTVVSFLSFAFTRNQTLIVKLVFPICPLSLEVETPMGEGKHRSLPNPTMQSSFKAV